MEDRECEAKPNIEQTNQDLHPLVLQFVLEHVDLTDLPTCRLVNHAWNDEATRLLNKSGVMLQFSGADAELYLKLLQPTAKTRRRQVSAPNLGILLFCSYSILDTAIKIASYTSGFTSLHCVIDRKGFESSYLTLIRLSGSTLREIKFTVFARVPKPVKDKLKLMWNSVRAKAHGSRSHAAEVSRNASHGSLKLPALKSISVSYEAEPEFVFLPYAIPRLILEVAMAAPHLETMQVDGWSNSAVIPATLSALNRLDSRKIDRLLELSLRIARPEFFAIMDNLHFNRLHELRLHISCEFVHVLNKLTQFVRGNCPALQSLQIIDESPYNNETHGDQTEDNVAAATAEQLRVLTVTHFGFLFGLNRQFAAGIANADTFLYNMSSFPNLSKISLNFSACTALASLFSRFGPTNKYRMAKWSKVTTVDIYIDSHAILSVWLLTDGGDLPQNINRAFDSMFPNLIKLKFVMGVHLVYRALGYNSHWAVFLNALDSGWQIELVGHVQWLLAVMDLPDEFEFFLRGGRSFEVTDQITLRAVQPSHIHPILRNDEEYYKSY